VAIGVASLCFDADYKAQLVKEAKKITCSYNPKMKTKSTDSYAISVELKGSELIHTYNKDSANVSETVPDFLKNAL
jgi:hypothetical protein